MVNSLDAHAPRTVFILDNDYGELGLAMYFLQGRRLADSATILLPPLLFAKNKDTVPGEVLEYRSLEDITRIVEEARPEIVFLFSGYILPLHAIVSLDDMANLVQFLEDRECKIVVSDPFFGIFSRMDPSGVSASDALRIFDAEILPQQSFGYRLSTTSGNIRILKRFAGASHIIKDATHLYYTRPGPDSEPIEVRTRNMMFFNPSLIDDERAPGSSSIVPSGEVDSCAPQEQHWMFILGSVDYDLQSSFYGEERFLALLVAKVEETLRAGRRPVFLAPDHCIQKMLSLAPVAARKGLMTFCAYEQFSFLLLKAEYVFYWNLASYSTFLRVINGAPIFMFDQGHLARHVKPMYQRMIQWYYQNWSPPTLNHHEVLNAGSLAQLSKDYEQDTGKIRENLKELPTPEQVVDDLLRT